MNRVVALAMVASLATISAPASANPAVNMPSGPAAQAILQWFTTDRSLGCSDSACTLIDSSASFEVYYGDSSGGGPKADALAFVYYGPYLTDGGNAVALAAAYFHRDGGSYRFVKTFTDSFGSRDITGTDVRFLRVQFLPGKVSITAEGLGGNGPRLVDYAVTLNPTAPAPRVGGALAASPEAAYLAARDKYIAEIKALENSKASQSAIDAAMDKALADLTKRLKDIVGPVSVKGFPGAGRLNLDTLSEHQVGYGNLDGVVYVDERPTSTNPPYVVVTTRSLLTAWLEGKAKDEDKESRLPTDVEAAVRQENFYSGGDVAFAKYADLPVTKPAGADLAVAALGLFRQDNTASPPDTIVATIVKGDRVFVASIPRTAPIGKIPACEAIWTEASRKADTLQAEYVASGLKDKKLAQEGIQAQHQGDGDAHACFNARAPKQSFFPGLTREAQSLVDRLALSTEARQQPVGGGTVLPHDAASQEAPPGISPELIQSWRDYIKDYPERLAEFQKEQAARRKEAKEIDFSKEKPDDIKKIYPSLYDSGDIAPDDIVPGTLIAESRGKINLLFVMDNDPLYCGSGGCGTEVYADEGAGYKPAFEALTFGPVYVTRTGGQTFMYLSDPNVVMPKYGTLTAEFILKGHKFVENKPPPREPDDPLYLKWRAFVGQHKNGPAPRVRHYENVDASGNDRGSWIRGVSSADCESICIADSGCAGYTYNRLRATCIPKNIVGRLMTSSEAAVTGVVEGR